MYSVSITIRRVWDRELLDILYILKTFYFFEEKLSILLALSLL